MPTAIPDRPKPTPMIKKGKGKARARDPSPPPVRPETGASRGVPVEEESPERRDRLLAEIASMLAESEGPAAARAGSRSHEKLSTSTSRQAAARPRSPSREAGSSRLHTSASERHPLLSESSLRQPPRGRFVELFDALSLPAELRASTESLGSIPSISASPARPPLSRSGSLSRQGSRTQLMTVPETEDVSRDMPGGLDDEATPTQTHHRLPEALRDPEREKGPQRYQPTKPSTAAQPSASQSRERPDTPDLWERERDRDKATPTAQLEDAPRPALLRSTSSPLPPREGTPNTWDRYLPTPLRDFRTPTPLRELRTRTPPPLRDMVSPYSSTGSRDSASYERELGRLRTELYSLRTKLHASVPTPSHEMTVAIVNDRAKSTVEAFRDELKTAHEQLKVAQEEIDKLGREREEAEESAKRARDLARRAADMVRTANARAEGLAKGLEEARREWGIVSLRYAAERDESGEDDRANEVVLVSSGQRGRNDEPRRRDSGDDTDADSWSIPDIPSEGFRTAASSRPASFGGPPVPAPRRPPPPGRRNTEPGSDSRMSFLEDTVQSLTGKLTRVRRQRDDLADRMRRIRDGNSSLSRRSSSSFSMISRPHSRSSSRTRSLDSEMARRTAARIELLFPAPGSGDSQYGDGEEDAQTTCIFHALNPDDIMPNHGPTPGGMLDCGCTVEEGLFEESLTRHGVGNFNVEDGTGVVIPADIRGSLLDLLERRFDYQDGTFEVAPHNGDWEDGEGPEMWEKGLEGTRSERSRGSRSDDGRTERSYGTASQY